MIVSVDIQAAIGQRAGVGRYTHSLAEHLSEWLAPEELRLVYFDFWGKGPPLGPGNRAQRAVRWWPRRALQAGWKTLNWPPYDWFAGRADVYHFTNYIRPPLTRGKSVATVFDLSVVRFPETMESRNLTYLKKKLGGTVTDSDAVITCSASIAEELCESFPVARGKIFPIPLGIDKTMKAPDAATTAAVRRRLGLTRPYLLMVGTLEPRKNIPFLLDVFENLNDFDGDLVLAGTRGWKYEPILQRMRSSRRADRIRHLEYVAEIDLPALYAGAELFVFPSLYEGFGLTPLEAMACGTAVISAPAGSLAEVLGEAAVLVKTENPGNWLEAVRRVLGDTELKSELISQGLEHAGLFSWRETARLTCDVYRKIAP
jgi:glycosyltransferase involved in cell wall biosynthesis